MKKRLNLLVAMVSVVILVFALNLGVVSAHEPPDPAVTNAWAPVGSGPGGAHAQGFDNPNSSAVEGITHNPLCPLHPGSH